MIPFYHPWTDWQYDYIDENDKIIWKWKKDTPKEIIKEYEEWQKYYNKKMKIK